MLQIKTQQSTSCLVFSLLKKLQLSQLPTYYDVMKTHLFIKHELKPEKNNEIADSYLCRKYKMKKG